MRQLSTVVAAVAQFTADNQTADVLDDGVVSNFESKFLAALQGAMSSSSVHYGIATGSGDAMVVTAVPPMTPATNGGYLPGSFLIVKTPATANASTAPTANVNSIGNIAITRAGSGALAAADNPASTWIILFFDGTGCYRIGLTASDVTRLAPTIPTPTAALNGGLQVSSGGAFALDTPNLPTNGTIGNSDLTALWAESAEGGVAAGAPYAATVAQLTAKIMASITNDSIWSIGSATTGPANAPVTVLAEVPQVASATAAACLGLCIRAQVTTTNTSTATLTFNTSAGEVTLPIVLNKTGAALSGGELAGGVGFEADWYCDGTSARLMNSVVSPPLPNVAKAWITFQQGSSPTVISSYGVSSLVRNGAGNYTINFNETLDSEPVVVCSANFINFFTSGGYYDPTNVSWTSKSTLSVSIGAVRANGAGSLFEPLDDFVVEVVIFGS
ncbi:MAG: hypothetical protein P4M05_28475 [Bradyrhizobium sp.]|nr:hypothetical protein [Bradyrhizobium sp.]